MAGDEHNERGALAGADPTDELAVLGGRMHRRRRHGPSRRGPVIGDAPARAVRGARSLEGERSRARAAFREGADGNSAARR